MLFFKEKIYGKHVLYSKSTLKHNPEMIEDRYKKLINDTLESITEYEDKLKNIYNKVDLLFTEVDMLDISELVKNNLLEYEIKDNELELKFSNFIYRSVYGGEYGITSSESKKVINNFYSVNIKELKERIEIYEKENNDIISKCEIKLIELNKKLFELQEEYKEFESRYKKLR